MENSLTDYINVIENTLHQDLISSVYLSGIKNITDIFPSQITSMFGFECRLGDNDPRADLAFSILPDIVAILKNIDSEKQFWPENNSIWKGVSKVINCLEEPELKDVIGLLWLEFDMWEHVNEIPAPGVFFSFEKYLRQDRLKLSREDTIRQLLSASDRVFSSLRGRDFFKKIRPAFAEALRLLPERSMLFQVGTMASRPGEYIRICIQNITPEEIITFLEEMKWPGSLEELYTLLLTLSDFSGIIVLALDLGEVILPKVGIEISFSEDTTVKDEPKWKGFVNYLTDEKLSTQKKADALLTYPGYVLESSDKGFWPLNLQNASLFWGKSIFINKLDHFKIIYQKDCPLEAKAYLAVYQEWIKKA
ncbi:MAG: hypothetical protein AB2L14_17060 [Candidatus Xenobiia bacterium LiM19]